MIQFDLISDLHLRKNYWETLNHYKAKSDILVVLGDVCELAFIKEYKRFFYHINREWKTVLYVLGNHEFYTGSLIDTCDIIRMLLEDCESIKILDNEIYKHNEYTFIGSTLWTDMNKNSERCKMVSKTDMSDYRYISKYNNIRIQPEDTIELFNKNLKFLNSTILPIKDNVIVLTHHAPSYKSIQEKYYTSLYNGAFYSDLDNFIESNPQIKCWCYGHTHSSSDFMIGNTQVVSNPKGYEKEIYPNYYQEFYTPLTITIE